MERYSSRTIDEAGRIVLHSELRNKLGLETSDKISLQNVGTIIILQRVEDDSQSECAVCQISELGQINLPGELRQKLDWNVKDSIALYHTDKMVILKKAE